MEKVHIFLDMEYKRVYNINEFGSNTILFMMCYVLVTYRLHKGTSIKTPYRYEVSPKEKGGNKNGKIYRPKQQTS